MEAADAAPMLRALGILNMRTKTEYDENYPTCSYTHAWLRIMSEDLDPDEITKTLGVEPNEMHRAGEPRSPKSKRLNETSGWFISTKGILNSLDSRHHLDWILEKVSTKEKELHSLQSRGYLVDVCVRWDSKGSSGGPTLSPRQLLGFGSLGVEVWFDIYCDDEVNDA
jgi:hypothetical protein